MAPPTIDPSRLPSIPKHLVHINDNSDNGVNRSSMIPRDYMDSGNRTESLRKLLRQSSAGELIGKAEGFLDEFNRLMQFQNYEKAHSAYVSALFIVSELIPKCSDYASLVQKPSSLYHDRFNSLSNRLLSEKRIDQLRMATQSNGDTSNRLANQNSKSSTFISSNSQPSDLEARLANLKATKSFQNPLKGNFELMKPNSQASTASQSYSNSTTGSAASSAISLNNIPPSVSSQQSSGYSFNQPSSLKPFPNLSSSTHISALELLNLLKSHGSDILLIDVRARRLFDEGHIDSPNAICIEPISLRSHSNDRKIEESLCVSPVEEQKLFSLRDKFELVVFYDFSSKFVELPNTSSTVSTGLNGRKADKYHFESALENVRALETLVMSLTDLVIKKPLKRDPVMLDGGVSSWTAVGGTIHSSSNPANHTLQPSSSNIAFRPGGTNGSVPVNHSNINISKPPEIIHRTEKTSLSRLGVSFPTADQGSFRKQDSSLVQTSDNRSSNSPLKSHSTTAFDQHLMSNRQGLVGNYPKIPLQSGQTTSAPVLPPKVPPFPPPVAVPAFSVRNATSEAMMGKNSYLEFKQDFTKMSRIDNFACGLKNLGNTCYMNCILQCLVGTKQLTSIFVDDSFKSHINMSNRLGYKGILANKYAEVVKTMVENDGAILSPAAFKVVCGKLRSDFVGFDQQDSQEFLTFLLDGLHEELNQCGGKPRMEELTPAQERNREKMSVRRASTIEWERYLKTDFSSIVTVLQGQYRSQLQCMSCGFTSTTYNSFSCLTLPIPPSNNKIVSLEECFQEFLKDEILDGDDRWFCTQCKARQRTRKSLQITRLPNVLIIHLNRFKQNQGFSFSGSLQKLETFVIYPVSTILDLTKFWPPYVADDKQLLAGTPLRDQIPPFRYKLYAVANHFGTLRGGHYTAYVKKKKRGWCYFDDTRVSYNCSVDDVCNKNAYVLFYARETNVGSWCS